MTTHPFRKFFTRQGLWLVLIATLFLGLANSLPAASAGRKLLKMEISQDRRSAQVVIPAGYGSVTLQRFEREGGWRKVSVLKAKPGVVKLTLPTAPKTTRWRAIGTFKASPSRGKFPAGFYSGAHIFGPIQSTSGFGGFISKNVYAPAGTEASGDVNPAPADAAPVEADIWKTDGSHVYFFNQLRGLQVLDVANPADPRLVASLRLPALGEDLYLLPDTGATKNLLLLTRHDAFGGGTMTRIRLVQFSEGKLTVTHRQDVPGWLNDSRMAGDRLILATTEWSYGFANKGAWTDTSITRLTQWAITPGGPPQNAGEFELKGENPLIAAGPGWLAVAETPTGQWSYSEVTVFSLSESGLVRLGRPLRTAGIVSDKFKIQWRNHVLTTISEHNGDSWNWEPVTVLENFRVWGPGVVYPAVVTDPLLGRLELAKGESLYATRFAGDKAYVVTFLQTDPLWVVDLTDPANPAVAGHIEVPGWSTYLEPLGNMLFSVGWESNTIAASLFDVTDPAAPTLLRRVNLGKPGSYSEAAWDEQALKVLPDAGLVMIPLTSYDDATGTSLASVQLLDLDLTAGKLEPRGAIRHDFDARRSTLIGNAVISISQRTMVAADISDRDLPAILSEVALAWPVDRVLDAGSHLVQIESGSQYMSGRAMARVSPASDTEAIFSETDLGEGTVRAAELRDGKLYVLRETGSYRAIYYRSPIVDDAPVGLHLDVYDASALPALPRLGSCSATIKPGDSVVGRGLVWPQPGRPCVVIQAASSFWYGWDYPIYRPLQPMLLDTGKALSSMVSTADAARIAIYPYPSIKPRSAPRLLAFDVSDATSPTAGHSIAVGMMDTSPNGLVEAADGLVVVGTSDWKNALTGVRVPVGRSIQSVYVVEVGTSGPPVVRPGIDLPGNAFAVTELDRDGFLVFTRGTSGEDGSTITVSACDGHDAFAVASVATKGAWTFAADARRLFASVGDGVQRHLLNDQGEFVAEPELAIGWNANDLRVTQGVLLGSTWNTLFAVETTSDIVKKWRFPAWSLRPEAIEVASDGDLLVPFGDYGARRLQGF